MTYAYVAPERYIAPDNVPHLVLCDVDGTVAMNDGHRGHYEYEKVGDDKPIWPIINLVNRLTPAGYPLIFMSGRQETCRDQTEKWLFKHGFRKPVVLMRAKDDHRPDWLIKGELFDAHIRDRYEVDYVVEDRNQVVRLWRDYGFTCLQVADGDF